jgi:hypothetical protein
MLKLSEISQLSRRFLILIPAAVATLYLLNTNISNIFLGDSLDKLVQAESIIKNHFISDTLYYPASDLDPEYHYTPFSVIKSGKSFLSPFPAAYGYLSALLLVFFSPVSLPIFSLLLFASTFTILYKLSGNSKSFLIYIPLLTALPFQYLGFGDLAAAVFPGFIGFALYFFKSPDFYNKKERPSALLMITAGVLGGSAIWFRLEALLLYISLLLSITFIKKKDSLTPDLLLFIGGFTAIAAAFFTYNQFFYGNALGIRYIFNEAGIQSSGGINTRLEIIQSLLFMGNMRIGFFMFMPFLLLMYLYYIIPGRFKSLNESDRIMLISSVLFIILVSLSAPNDSNIDWGSRYLSFALLPAIILYSRFTETIRNNTEFSLNRYFRILNIIFTVITVMIHLLMLVYMHKAPEQITKFQKEFHQNTEPADLYIFTDRFHAQHLTYDILSKKIIVINEVSENANDLLTRIQADPKYRKIALISMPPQKVMDAFNTIQEKQMKSADGLDKMLRDHFVFQSENILTFNHIRYYSR